VLSGDGFVVGVIQGDRDSFALARATSLSSRHLLFLLKMSQK
jgi:hypothetical protein